MQRAASAYAETVSEPAHRALTRTAYDAVAKDYATLLPGLDAEATLEVAMIDDFAARCLAERAGPVADIGCGAGRLSAYLSRRGLDIRGFDLSPAMVDVARRTHPDLDFEVAAMQSLPVEEGFFGGLLAWYSMIHTPPAELDEAVDECARVLRPGGYLLAAFQAGDGQRVDRPSGYGRPVTFTSYRHDPDVLSALFEGKGFDVRARLLRAAEGREWAPQAFVFATRRQD